MVTKETAESGAVANQWRHRRLKRETWSQRVGSSKYAVSPVNEQLTPPTMPVCNNGQPTPAQQPLFDLYTKIQRTQRDKSVYLLFLKLDMCPSVTPYRDYFFN